MTTLSQIAQQWVSDGKEIRPVNPYEFKPSPFLSGETNNDNYLWASFKTIQNQHTYATSLPSGTYDVSELKEPIAQWSLKNQNAWQEIILKIPFHKWRSNMPAYIYDTRLFITKKEQEVKQEEESVERVTGNIHQLKTWPLYFKAVKHGLKNFEVRKRDRDFQVGDTLILQEFDPAKNNYSGDTIEKVISYILPGGEFGINDGYDVLGLKNKNSIHRDPEVQSLTQSRDNLLSKYTAKRTEVLNLEYQLVEAKKEIEKLSSHIEAIKSLWVISNLDNSHPEFVRGIGTACILLGFTEEDLTNSLNK